MPCFVDTNILLYSKSTDPADSGKRLIAAKILERDDCVLSVQVMQEFYVQATRVSRPNRMSHDVAAGLINAWTRFPVQELTMEVFGYALELRQRYGFSYWDCAIIAAASFATCDTLFSEDMQHQQIVNGVRIVNPFNAG